MIIYNIEQGSEAWYQARLGRVTGTRFADLVAAKSTKRYTDLVIDIACEIISGKVSEDDYVSPIMEEAKEKEPEAIKEYENIFDCKIIKAGFVIPDEDNKYHDWIGVSPDGLLPSIQPIKLSGGGIEIKCPLIKTHIGYLVKNELPSIYRHQVQGNLFVTGLAFWDFVSYYEGMKLFCIRVLPDKEQFKEYQERLDILIKEVTETIDIYKIYTNE